MSLLDITDNKLALTLIAAVAGILLTTIVQKILSKTVRFRYSTNVQRVAISADDDVFGAVRVTWGNSPMRNLYLAQLEIENGSSQDFENVEFKVYVPNETVLLGERSSIEGTPYIVPWGDAFKASITVANSAAATDAQQKMYHHSRDYLLKVFNRGQLLRLNYLCTRPNDDNKPELFVSTMLKGARMFRHNRRLFYGVPHNNALVRGLFISALAVLVCGHYLHNVWFAAILCMIVGLMVLPLGVLAYRLERGLRKLIVD
ncbi:MAG TPA: hypothetical protein VHV29_02155 [Terriglobales bacterium]|jgi:hypothetical protein|nr:hypothetical protein [Terriglobales bacterium]